MKFGWKINIKVNYISQFSVPCHILFSDIISSGDIGVVNITMLKKNPNIHHFIVGKKDTKEVVKVFLCGDDKEEEKAQADFKKAVFISKETHIEFINLDKRSKEILKEREEIQKHEETASVIDESKRLQMQKVINKNKRKIFEEHSNILGITSSNVRYDGKTFFEEPCIVFYCLEKMLYHLEKSHCLLELKDGLVSNKAFPEPGCSIGVELSNEVGSVGVLVGSVVEAICGNYTDRGIDLVFVHSDAPKRDGMIFQFCFPLETFCLDSFDYVIFFLLKDLRSFALLFIFFFCRNV